MERASTYSISYAQFAPYSTLSGPKSSDLPRARPPIEVDFSVSPVFSNYSELKFYGQENQVKRINTEDREKGENTEREITWLVDTNCSRPYDFV
jgi:hypothetical protein